MNPSLRPSSREALISLATVLTDTDFSNLEMAMGEVDINADMKNADTNDDTSDEDMTLPPPKYYFGIELHSEDLATIQAKSIKSEHVVVRKIFRDADQVGIDVLSLLQQIPPHPTRETKHKLQKLIKDYLAQCGLPTSRPSENRNRQKKLKYEFFSG